MKVVTESGTPAKRVRDRIRRWLETTGLGQREFAETVGKSQVWLQKVLSGENDVRLAHLDDVAQAMRSTSAELVRNEDDRYRLELTPTEVRIIEQLRRHPDMFVGIGMLLQIPVVPPGAKHDASLTIAKGHKHPAK